MEGQASERTWIWDAKMGLAGAAMIRLRIYAGVLGMRQVHEQRIKASQPIMLMVCPQPINPSTPLSESASARYIRIGCKAVEQ